MLIYKKNYQELYPEGVKWPNMFGGDTAHKLPHRVGPVPGENYFPRFYTYPEDILELYEKKFRTTRHLPQLKYLHKKWQYMIDRSKEIIDEK